MRLGRQVRLSRSRHQNIQRYLIKEEKVCTFIRMFLCTTVQTTAPILSSDSVSNVVKLKKGFFCIKILGLFFKSAFTFWRVDFCTVSAKQYSVNFATATVSILVGEAESQSPKPNPPTIYFYFPTKRIERHERWEFKPHPDPHPHKMEKKEMKMFALI